MINSSQVQRIYLDELDQAATSLGVGVLRLIVEPEALIVNQAKLLIQQANRELDVEPTRQGILDLIDTIVVYKFPKLSRQEIETMLNLDALKHTRVYQDALEEGREEGLRQGKLATVPLLLQAGLTIDQIAEQLDLDRESVQQAAGQLT